MFFASLRGQRLHLFVIPPWILLALVAAVTVLAFWKGGWRERVFAAYEAALYVGFQAWEALLWGVGSVAPLQARVGWNLVTDAMLLAICVALSLRSDRYWPIWAASLALLSLATDVLASTRSLTMWTYLSALLIWNYALLAVQLWGVISYRRQLAAQKR